MGYAKYDKTKKKLIIPAILGDVYRALDENAYRDGQATTIVLTVKGSSEVTTSFEITNIDEILEILALNADTD